MNLEFTVPGKPETKGSWKVIMRHGRPVLVPDNEMEPGWAALVGWQAKLALRKIAPPAYFEASSERFAVRLVFTLPAPPNKRRTNRRDLDKLARSVLDALTGIVWRDDEQVEDLELSKRVGDAPGVRVEIESKCEA